MPIPTVHPGRCSCRASHAPPHSRYGSSWRRMWSSTSPGEGKISGPQGSVPYQALASPHYSPLPVPCPDSPECWLLENEISQHFSQPSLRIWGSLPSRLFPLSREEDSQSSDTQSPLALIGEVSLWERVAQLRWPPRKPPSSLNSPKSSIIHIPPGPGSCLTL